MERHSESSRNQGVCIEISYKLGSLSKAAERKVNQADHQIYVRPLANGSHAVAILNCGDKDKSIQADFKQLGLNGKYLIRDVWQHRDIAKKANRWKGIVKAHETKVFVLK